MAENPQEIEIHDWLMDPAEAPGTAWTAAREAAKSVPDLLAAVRAEPSDRNTTRLFAAMYPTLKIGEDYHRGADLYRLRAYKWNNRSERFTLAGRRWITDHWSRRDSTIYPLSMAGEGE